MKTTKFLLIIFLIAVGSNSLMAQNSLTVSGTVSDPDGETLIGVTILEEGTSNGTITNIDGEYKLTLTQENAVLIFSYAGFKKVKINTNGRTTINVKMEMDIEELDQVVVTALGFKEDKDELGYANSKIETENVTRSGETTLLNGMAGKASGVRISRSSGDPGSGSFIQIRGLSTINGDGQPLIVLDGVPISNDSRGSGEQRSVVQQSRLNDINPNDIADIQILKGASAAALWGTQAVGGVIYITTKSGKYNEKLNITVRSSYSLDEVNVRYPIQTKFGQGANGNFIADETVTWGDKIADRAGGPDEFNTSGEFFIGENGQIYYPIASKNSRETFIDSNFDDVIQQGTSWENSVSLSGGNETGRFYFSMSDMDQEGIIRNNSDYRRSTVRFNAEQNFSEIFQLNANANYTRTSSRRIQKGASASGLYLGLLRTPTDFDNRGYVGDYYASENAAPITYRHRSYRNSLGQNFNPGFNNPAWTINEQESEALVDRFTTTIKATVSPTRWLDLIARAGVDHYSEERQEFFTPGSARPEFDEGYFGSEIATNTIFNSDLIAKATRNFGSDFNGNLLVGFNFNHKKRATNSTAINSFLQFAKVSDGLRDIDNAVPQNQIIGSTFGSERTAAVYSSVQFAAYDMLFLKGTVRAESASTFGNTANNTFIFPSTSLAWQFTKLDFLENSILNFGKLRFAYGEVGVQPSRYQTSNLYVSPTYSDQFGGALNTALFGNGVFVPSVAVGNTQLRPERKKEFEIGTDLRFIQDKLSFSGTYFYNRTEDVLLDFPIAQSRGYRRIFDNGGEIENKGVELDLGYQILQSDEFSWNVNLIYSRIRNKVLDLRGVQSIDLGGTAQISGRAVEGQPLGAFWGGRYRRNEDGSLALSSNGFPQLDPEDGLIGDPNPDWQGSVISGFRYKNFNLNVLFETFQGGDVTNATRGVMVGYGLDEETGNEVTAESNLLDINGNIIPVGTTFRGNVEDFGAGNVALTEDYYRTIGNWFGGLHEQYVVDGSWTRLRELSLGYTLNSEKFKQFTKLTSANITLTGRNLFLWTDYIGNDPDTNLTGVSIARGIDYFNNPGTKSYIATVTLNF
jgi:TonB-linked SusC/RagA family outer membrane protein